MMLHYFAYGSNLHPVRLIERIPSAELIGAVELPGYRLEFHKTSEDGSGKCNAFATGLPSDLIHGALYQLAFEHKPILDRIEGTGNGGYIASEISVWHGHHEYACFTYLAKPSHINDNLEPYHWYKQLVVLGAKYLEFPEAYIESIESVKSKEDPNQKRRQENQTLLQKIRKFDRDNAGKTHPKSRKPTHGGSNEMA